MKFTTPTPLKIKSLFISYDGLTDPLGQSQIIPYLAGLSKKGYEIHILSCEKKDNFEKQNKIISETLDKHNITWHKIFYHKNPPILSTLFDVYKLNKKALLLYGKFNYQIIHCRSYLPALIGLNLKKKYPIKFIFDMRGFWADERVDGNLWNLNNPVYKWIYNYFKKKEKEFLLNADAIISLTDAGKMEMLSWKLGEKSIEQKIHIIPCCVDLQLFSNEYKNSQNQQTLKKHLKIVDSDFVLTYLGSIGTWYMLDEMLQFYKQLQSKRKNAKFLFVSPHSSHKEIEKGISKYNLPQENIMIVEASRKDVPLYLSISSYSIFFIKPVYSKMSSSPTKQAEIMAMGIPVICNSNIGDTNQIVERYNSGILTKTFDNISFNDIMDKMDNIKFDEIELRKGAIEYFSLEEGVRKYLNIYNQITERNVNDRI